MRIETREKLIGSKVSGHFFGFLFEKSGFFKFGLLVFVRVWLFFLKGPLADILIIQESWLFVFDIIVKCVDGKVVGNSIIVIHLKAKNLIQKYFSSSSVKYMFTPVARLVI